MKFDSYNLLVWAVCMLTGIFVPSIRWPMLMLQIGLSVGGLLGKHYLK